MTTELAIYHPVTRLTSAISTSCSVPKAFYAGYRYALKDSPVAVLKSLDRTAVVHFLSAPTGKDDVIGLEDLHFPS